MMGKSNYLNGTASGMQYKVFTLQNLHSPPLSCSPKNTPHQSEYISFFNSSRHHLLSLALVGSSNYLLKSSPANIKGMNNLKGINQAKRMEGDFPKLVGSHPNLANLALWCRHGDIIHLKPAGNSSVLQVSGVNTDLEARGGFLECFCVF